MGQRLLATRISVWRHVFISFSKPCLTVQWGDSWWEAQGRSILKGITMLAVSPCGEGGD